MRRSPIPRFPCFHSQILQRHLFVFLKQPCSESKQKWVTVCWYDRRMVYSWSKPQCEIFSNLQGSTLCNKKKALPQTIWSIGRLLTFISCSMIYTCDLLLWQSLCLGMRDYETLAQAVGGRWYRIFVEVWLVILMIGTLISSVVQVTTFFRY